MLHSSDADGLDCIENKEEEEVDLGYEGVARWDERILPLTN
jgi:hypothetical protein